MIEIENTYNPDVLNFYFDNTLLPQGGFLFADKQTPTQNNSLMQNIMSVDGLKRALLLPDMLFVQKQQAADFDILAPQIMAFLTDSAPIDKTDDVLSKNCVEALIESRIRPFLKRDGGDIELIDFSLHTLRLRFEGHCKGCPHADQTLKNAVIAIIEKYFPQIKKVIREA